MPFWQSGSVKTFYFKKKWAKPGLFLFYFRPFLVTISIIQIEKKRSRCACDLNPGTQDGRQRQNHEAMAFIHFFNIQKHRFCSIRKALPAPASRQSNRRSQKILSSRPPTSRGRKFASSRCPSPGSQNIPSSRSLRHRRFKVSCYPGPW